jgi:hypothetical protein
MPTSARRSQPPPAREFFYLDADGNRQDAELHDAILAEGDEAAATAVTQRRERQREATKSLLSSREFDPNEPRDESGKWTDGGGGDGGGGTPGYSDVVADHARDVLSAGRDVAEKLGYDPKLVSIGSNDDPDRTFTLNGQQYKAAGLAYTRSDSKTPGGPKKGEIVLFPGAIGSADSARGVAAHEVEHHKFQQALDRYQVEREAVMKDPGPPPDPNHQYWWGRKGGTDAMMKPDGTLRPPYDEKYPVYQAMEQAYRMHPSEYFAESDGVSDYSIDWWREWKGDKSGPNYEKAMHETLAEMGKAKYQTGKFPPNDTARLLSWRDEGKPAPTQATINEHSKRWRDLYRTVERVYRGKA